MHGFFTRWANTGVAEHIRDQLREQVRARAGRNPTPSAAAIDSPTARAAETVRNHDHYDDPTPGTRKKPGQHHLTRIKDGL
jgi:hypothetical protein